MRNIWTICRKELRSYFSSPIGYVALAIYAVVFGYFFWTILAYVVSSSMAMQMRGNNYPMNINEEIVRPLLQNIGVVDLLVIPLITMRLFAEEKRTGTIELLATSPVSDFEVILGKWLGAMLLYGSMLLVTALNFGFLFKYGNPDWKPLVIGYLGLYLQGGTLLALGAFISSLTKNQIIAGAVTFTVCLLLWILDWVGGGGFDTGTWTQVVSYMGVRTHYESFGKGMLSSKDVIYYVSFIFLGLFLTARSMESLRWRS
jgi:ABC-2 type transport system permease protein